MTPVCFGLCGIAVELSDGVSVAGCNKPVDRAPKWGNPLSSEGLSPYTDLSTLDILILGVSAVRAGTFLVLDERGSATL